MHLPIWSPAPERLALASDEIHLWRIPLGEVPVEAVGDALSAEEILRASRFFHKSDTDRFIAARGALRMILARYLRTAPELVNLAAGPNGKPRLIHPFMDLRFNVSHSHDLALIGITLGREIGVDVERVQQEILFEEIAAHYFEPTEVWELRTMPPEERVWKFFDFWTRKEACLKASGRGLDGLGKPDENQWGVRGFSPAAGYAGAVASHGDDWRLACWDWSL